MIVKQWLHLQRQVEISKLQDQKKKLLDMEDRSSSSEEELDDIDKQIKTL